jgi:patatin-related protein
MSSHEPSPVPAAPVPPTPPAAPAAARARPPAGPTREVRFAVVMYGGVSLCIYMNGIAQELLHLVRATAPGDTPGTPRYPDEALSPTEKVYRDLSRLLVEGRAPGAPLVEGGPLGTRFSVDILSGTSAGGINAIFLAKALTNDESMAQLKQLWMTEGDIAKLINDGASIQGTALPRPAAPQSLLNGHRMYQKLVEAFEGMDEAAGVTATSPARPPLVPELDLFVTTTDIAGVTLPIRLADGVVHERRHRGVFHFRFKKEDGVDPPEPNDFARPYNPFLAFAARCTSAFPFAFEPMRLEHMNAVLETMKGFGAREKGWHSLPLWEPFLERFKTPAGTAPVSVEKRSFGDGGYLDNKPFSYASESLLRRESGIPVDRKLLYIEPKPEHPERDSARTEFDAIENVMAATVGLPRYETIREDLERVMARNRLTERVRIITQALEEDVPAEAERMGIQDAGDWSKLYLKDMVKQYGIAYGGYHRLRVAAATDWLAKVVSRAAGLGEASDLVLATRQLVRVWRNDNYQPHGTPENPRASENQFLLDYDLQFRIRRLAYVLSKINTLSAWGQDARRAVAKIMGVRADFVGSPISPTEEEELHAELVALKGVFHPLYRTLRQAQEQLELRGEKNPLRAAVTALGLHPPDLLHLLALSGPAQENAAQALLNAEGRREALANVVARLEEQLADARREASAQVFQRLDPARVVYLTPGGEIARRVLWHYYNFYVDYDLVSFPILYSTDAGEEDTVDIIRISPEDARYIFDETGDPLGRRKLAGTALFSFGAFLRDTWRANDMLWGRLDGAERLVCALLPDEADRAIRLQLLRQVSEAILAEEFKPAARAEVSRLMSESLVSVAAGRPAESAVARLSATVGNERLGTRLQAVLSDCVDDEKLLAYFKKQYEVNRELDPQETLGAMARGSRVVGHMLEGISARHSVEGKRVRWVTRAASWFWGLVQVAVPRSVPALIFDHWLGLLYALALLQVLVGVFAGPVLMGWGVRLLGLTLVANVVVLLLRDYMRRRGVVAAALVALAVIAAVGIAAAGVAWIADTAVAEGVIGRVSAALPAGPWTRMTALQGLCGALGLAMAGAAATLLLMRRRWNGWLPGGFSAPGLAAEFVRDADELSMLTRGVLLRPIPREDGETDERKKLREQRDRDIREHGPKHLEIPGKVIKGVYGDYVFIVAYWILFVLLADRLLAITQARPGGLEPLAEGIAGFLGLAGGTGPADVARVLHTLLRIAGVGALVAGTAAAALDFVENGRIHEAFTAGRGREEQWMADGIRTAALWKWSLVFVTVLLLSPLFFWDDAPRRVLGLFSMTGPALGAFWIVVGIAGLVSLWKRPRLVEVVMLLLGLGLIAAAFLLPAVQVR